ncbi:SDR family oxidoreductase [Candidatus Bathyarchaeota archaeon]|nr:SDR family oxidoreductase [Candidatus Bathyarchaeota archaeon]
MDLGLRDRVAIVTGSSRGIGRAVAHGLASEGAKVTICARHEVDLKEASEFIRSSTGVQALPVKVDLKKPGDIKRMVRKTVQKFGRVDILVNNTGGPPTTLFQEISERVWRETVDLLLMSVVNCCKEVIPHMKKQGWGGIVNMTSFGAKQPAERLVLSNTLRSGILGLTKTLSNELAEYGILVNAICPGWTWTKRVDDLAISQAEKTGKKREEVIVEWASQIPLKRLAKPEEIASLAVFLASEKASYITGAVIQVDGGLIKSLI